MNISLYTLVGFIVATKLMHLTPKFGLDLGDPNDISVNNCGPQCHVTMLLRGLERP